MDDKARLQHIKSVVIRPKKNGQIRNLYNKDFDFLIEQAEEAERLTDFINTLQVVHFTELQREKATVERYEKALKFYANENSYVTNIRGLFDIEATVMIDNGDKAREALKIEE